MKHHNSAPTERFSNTVEDYAKYRPGYPVAVIELLKNKCGLHNESIIADIGSGTGIFAKLLLEHGFRVFGIEPNPDMRKKAEEILSHFPAFTSLATKAEATGLPDQSIDCVTAATSFHWFDREKAKIEFKRILKPHGWCLLVWNLRIFEASLFMQGYEALLNQYGIDYRNVCAEKIDDEDVRIFFKPSTVNILSFPNKQIFNWDGFKGRLLSTSYSPKPGHRDFEIMMNAAQKLFDECQQNNLVEFIYNTKCYFGHLDAL